MLGGRRDIPLMRNAGGGGGGGGVHSQYRKRIWVAVAVGILLGCVFAFLYPTGLLFSTPRRNLSRTISSSISKVVSSTCESSQSVKMLKSQFIAASKKNAELKREIQELNDKLLLVEQAKDNAVKELNEKLRLTEQAKYDAVKEVLRMGEQYKTGPFGTVKASRTNPTVIPDKSVNKRLAKLLEKIAINRELIVSIANYRVKELLEIWFTSIKRVGITNYLVVPLDEEIAHFCMENGVPVYKMDPDEEIDSVGRTGGNHAISGLKFKILRDFLQLNYSVLLSDIDVLYLQNPFEYLYRDSDVECMSDGHNNLTAYGFNDVFDDPEMGWARYAHTMRIWVYNSGFFYIRPTFPSIELLDRVVARLARDPNSWDQAVFNEELFMPSYPGYDGLYASRRTMDILLFMNSKFLFKIARKDAKLSKLNPVVVHVNYHPDKHARLNAAIEYYINGKEDALQGFPDGSKW